MWTELCRSNAVLVDITDLDENVCLALGVAQALGRSVLVIVHDEKPALFPEIADLRCETYRDGAELEAHVRAFLGR